MTIRSNPILRGLAVSVFSLVLGAPAAMAADPVALTLYNGPHKEIGEAIAKAYEAKTGIHINIRKGSSNQLASQIIEEGDRSPADVDEAPDTGLPPEWERALSAPFVVHERYGTRCSSVLLVEHDGRTTVCERRFDQGGNTTGATRLEFASADLPA